jgi:hypothetical protein
MYVCVCVCDCGWQVYVRMKRRCQQMEIFQQEAAVRLAKVKEEMAILTPDDFEKGRVTCDKGK